jgi:cobyrinic acid a,c-diamide synthase
VIDPVTGVQVVAECGGLYYVDVITAAGTELKILGTVQPGPVNAADWRLIP